jgi:GDPmannose 4,6-dehydratase
MITGITGQDGSFLAELLLHKGYTVWGVTRAGANASLGCSEHLRGQIELVHGDLLEPATLHSAIDELRPQEIYHLAAPSFVPASWERPGETMRAIVGSCAAILEAVRELDPSMRLFAAASGTMFGDVGVSPQREDTPCRPTSPYAVAKLAAHQLLGLLRMHKGLYACSGIAFNHESERRPERFVTRRVSRAAAAISLGLQEELTLGSLDAVRDWSFAGDIMEGAWLMLQQDLPDDYVLASGMAHTVAELADVAFSYVGLEAERYIRIDESLVRDKESTPNVGDPTRVHERLGWSPRVGFEDLVRRMVEADLQSLQAAAACT